MKYISSFTSLILLILIVSCSKNDNKSFEKIKLNDWVIRNTDSVNAGGDKISSGEFNTHNWYPAKVPGTVLHTLVKNKVYTDIFVDDNLEKIPTGQFKKAWWYRTQFNLDKVPGGLLLGIDGINYKANIWLNGKLIADTSIVINTFRQFKLDIKKNVISGKNTLAIEVFPPRDGDFSMGFVDWNPIAPDRNMGIFREVFIEENNGIGVSDPFITSSLNDDLTAATLQASVVVTNFTGKTQSGAVNLSIGSKNISKKIVLAAGESHKVIFTASGFPQLKINSPKLWWPHTIGTPNMYQAAFSFQEGNTIFDRKKVDFGIRTVSSYLTPDGHRAYRINGKKIQIHGAGWTDRMLLDDTPESVKEQLTYVKDINLNTIRLEGFWGNSQAIYNLCDQMGILVMVGWSCQWEWPKRLGKATDNKYGGILNDEDMSMMSEAWKDQIVWLRNHPSIFTWFAGSDLEPKPELERKYFEILKTYDSTRVYLASAKKTTTLAGPTGVKMEGPYAYIPPVYWFSDSIKGGAYGFATEIGPGAQVPPAESIKKMLSEKHWWPKDEMWNYHSGRGKFGTLDRFTKALEKRYGKITDFDDFEKKAQLLNYELMRPMFEAYSARRYKATGLILWMLNSAWPEMYWQLYDYYLMPSAAYYGAKTAQRPYHVIYDYYRKSLVVVNDKLTDKNNCKLKLRVYDTNSVLKFQKDIDVDLKANIPKEILVLPKLNIPSMYFIDTRLYDETGNEIDNNFYWVSQKEDILDYNDTSEAWYVTTVSKQYADFTALNKMQKLKVESKMLVKKVNEKTTFEVTLKNTSDKIAFFIHSAIIDSKTGKTILPVIWSDNYVSLLPGEERVLMAGINNTKLKGTEIKLVVDGYNLK